MILALGMSRASIGIGLRQLALVCLCVFAAGTAWGAEQSVSALLVSDIHFDPFHDPAIASQLTAAPVGEWAAILAAAPSPEQAKRFAALQDVCHARGIDTPYALLRSSLEAMKANSPHPVMMLVSGDLIVHSFDCRYKAIFPSAGDADYQDFVLKTLSFVMEQLRGAFPGTPVYAALGNNDSACGDYRMDEGSDFLRKAAQIFAPSLPGAQADSYAKSFKDQGNYTVDLAPAIRDTSLIVIDDNFLSPKFRSCNGEKDPSAGESELKWMRSQLAEARAHGRRVWIMGHIPPGVDPFSTVINMKNVCGGEDPVLFQAPNPHGESLAELLVDYADVVRLGIFGHSHMDEMRLLKGTASAAPVKEVSVKIVPSISPVDGNNPAFTIAEVDTSTARLKDYRVIAASNQTGLGTQWSMEYDYAKSYSRADFGPVVLQSLIADFKADPKASKDESQAYIRGYFVGDRSPELKPIWPQYVCALENFSARAFASCVCAMK